MAKIKQEPLPDNICCVCSQCIGEHKVTKGEQTLWYCGDCYFFATFELINFYYVLNHAW